MQFFDLNRLKNFYKDSLSAYGSEDARSVHWSDRHNQEKRFAVLSRITDLNGKSVLDVGCGVGDLYKYFLQNHIDVRYRGIDIMSEFIHEAKNKYPNADFEEKDILDIPESEKYDVVLASGALSFKVENNKEHYFAVIKKMFEHTNIALAFNMLDRSNHIDDEFYAAYDSGEVADFCKTLTLKVEIIMGYLPQDFTVYMYK